MLVIVNAAFKTIQVNCGDLYTMKYTRNIGGSLIN